MRMGMGMRTHPGQVYAQNEKARNRKDTLLRLLRFVMQHYRFSFLVVFACIIVSSVATLLSTLFTRTLIDDYIQPLKQVADPDFTPLAGALLKLGAVLVVGVACSYAYNRIMISVSQGTMLRLRKSMFSRMQQLPIGFFDSHSHGNIMSTYTNDVDSLRQVISSSLPSAFSSLITLAITFTSMVVLSLPLTGVSILMSIVMAWATTKLGKMSRKHFVAQQQRLDAVNGFIEEMMTGQKVVKVFCYEEEAKRRFTQLNDELRSSAYNANKIANIVMPVNGNLGNLAYVLIAVVGASIALQSGSALTIGTLVAFLTLNKNFSQPIAHISQQINSVLNASAGAERVFDLLDEQPETDNGKVEIVDAVEEPDGLVRVANGRTGTWAWRTPDGQLTKVEGGVSFDMVDFSYVPEKQVLFDIVLKAMPDQKIAFVGGTGAGKTTITNLTTSRTARYNTTASISTTSRRGTSVGVSAWCFRRHNSSREPSWTTFDTDDSTPPTKNVSRRPNLSGPTTSYDVSPTVTSPLSTDKGRTSAKASGSCSPLRVPPSPTHRCSFSTRLHRRLTPVQKDSCRRGWTRSCGGVPPSSSHTASPPCAIPTVSSCWNGDASSRAAHTTNCLPSRENISNFTRAMRFDHKNFKQTA